MEAAIRWFIIRYLAMQTYHGIIYQVYDGLLKERCCCIRIDNNIDNSTFLYILRVRRVKQSKFLKIQNFIKNFKKADLTKNGILVTVRDRAKHTKIWDHKSKEIQITKIFKNSKFYEKFKMSELTKTFPKQTKIWDHKS